MAWMPDQRPFCASLSFGIDRVPHHLPGCQPKRGITMPIKNDLHTFLYILDRWDEAKFPYTIARYGKDALMIRAEVPTEPTERWEVRFFADGHVEAEAFKSVAVESGDRLDIVLGKLRERPELAPENNFLCVVPTDNPKR